MHNFMTHTHTTHTVSIVVYVVETLLLFSEQYLAKRKDCTELSDALNLLKSDIDKASYCYIME